MLADHRRELTLAYPKKALRIVAHHFRLRIREGLELCSRIGRVVLALERTRYRCCNRPPAGALVDCRGILHSVHNLEDILPCEQPTVDRLCNLGPCVCVVERTVELTQLLLVLGPRHRLGAVYRSQTVHHDLVHAVRIRSLAEHGECLVDGVRGRFSGELVLYLEGCLIDARAHVGHQLVQHLAGEPFLVAVALQPLGCILLVELVDLGAELIARCIEVESLAVEFCAGILQQFAHIVLHLELSAACIRPVEILVGYLRYLELSLRLITGELCDAAYRLPKLLQSRSKVQFHTPPPNPRFQSLSLPRVALGWLKYGLITFPALSVIPDPHRFSLAPHP